MSEWISVKDRLPDGERQVLAVNSNGYMACVTQLHFIDGSYHGEDATPEDVTEPISDVTHWMPLPESPHKPSTAPEALCPFCKKVGCPPDCMGHYP